MSLVMFPKALTSGKYLEEGRDEVSVVLKLCDNSAAFFGLEHTHNG